MANGYCRLVSGVPLVALFGALGAQLKRETPKIRPHQ